MMADDRPMMTAEDARLAEIKARWPTWDIWFVRQVYGPGTWCAKPAGAKLATVNKSDADDLDEWLGEQP
ncbi:MAG: hypothetical protein JWM19_2250 [Actinomycetia bacterium]|nr:hypothetical protein [Actinomycetes bacterium]